MLFTIKLILFLIFTGLHVNANLEADFEKYKSNLSIANIEFSLKCLQAVGLSQVENVIYSPLGIMHSFSLLMLGARGTTRAQLMEALKYNYNFDNFTMVHKTFRAFNEVMKNVDGDVILKHANRVLVNHDFETNEEFKSAASKYYNTSVEEVYFEDDGDKILEETNAWVSNQTNNKIKGLIKHKFRSDSLMILLNAVYFRGFWESQFLTENTTTRTFFVNGEEEKDVSFMHQLNTYNYTETTEFVLLSLNYDSEFSFVVLLPHTKNGLQKIINEIDRKTIEESMAHLTETKLNLYLPKFKLEQTYKLRDFMGEIDLFTQEADLTGISNHGNLFVSEAIHKSSIHVNEKGSEAAAASSIQIRGRSVEEIKTVDCDHPFIFFIKHKQTGIIWFMGILSHFK